MPIVKVRRAAGGIEGIVNGMDTDDWCPTVDKFLDVKYDERTVAFGKAAAKETLQAELGLPVRDLSYIARYVTVAPGVLADTGCAVATQL